MQILRTLALAASCALGTGLATAQTTWYVDANAGPGGSGTQADPYDSIQYCLEVAAADGDEILVLPGTYGAIDYGGLTVRIASMAGPSMTILDATQSGSVVTVQSAEMDGTTLEGFRITGGTGVPALGEDRVGGGLFLSGASLTVKNCEFDANDAVVGAGGFVIDGDLVLEDTLFVDNIAHEGQPAVVEDGDGGALFLAAGSDVVVRRCTFDANVAGGVPLNTIGRGGAIFVSQSQLTVEDSTFVDNFASCNQNVGVGRGGAIHAADQSRVSVLRSVFTRNLTFANTAQGGAIWVDDADVRIRESLFDQNVAGDFIQVVDGEGGAIYTTSLARLFVANSVFQRNEAPLAGGAVFGYGTYVGCEFYGNKGREGGAAYAAHGGGLVFRSSTFVRNQATCFTFCEKDGGAVYGPARLYQCALLSNLAHGQGGAAWGAFLRDCVLDGNRSRSLPGAQVASLAGGGAYNSTLYDCVVSNNRVEGDPAIGVMSFGGGAAACEIVLSEVFGNEADIGGGVSNCDLDRVTVTQNTGLVDADGFWTDESRLVTNSIVWGNGTEIVDDAGLLTVTYTDVLGGWSGMGNIDADPQWFDPANQDFHLQAGSPCIDAGDPTVLDPDGSVADMGGIAFDRSH